MMAASSEEEMLHLSEINPSLESGLSSRESSATAAHSGGTSLSTECNPSSDMTSINSPSEGTSLITECNPSSNMSSSDGICSTDLLEKEKVERIEIVIESMREMFVTFFKPNDIVKVVFDTEDSPASKLLQESPCYPERRMHALLEELINSETPSPLVKFYKLITTLDPETNCLPLALLSGAGEKLHEKISSSMELIKEIVEKSNVNNLNSTDMELIVADMSEADFMKIPSRKSKQFSSFLSLLKSTWFSKSKPDWPFHLWEVLLKIRPDLFVSSHSRLQAPTNEEPENQIDSLKENFTDGTATSDVAAHNDSYMGLKKKLPIKLEEVHKESLAMLVNQGALKWDQVSHEEISENTVKKTPPEGSVQKTFSDDEDEDDEKANEKDEETHPKVAVEDAGNPNNKADLNLRGYQNELAKNALEGENTIILAPTGSGKTRVALDIIIKHLRGNQGQTRRRKVCFFAQTVPLADQQYKSICKFLPSEYKAQLFTGDSEQSVYLHLLLDKLDVVVLTPMILLNHLQSKNIKDLCVFSLLVFDECHHTREKEPYNILMSSYVDQKLEGKTKLPQVVGLTASFPVEKAKDVKAAAESIRKICANMDTSLISFVQENIKELQETVAVPTEESYELQEMDGNETFRMITNVMEKLEKHAKHSAEEIKNDTILMKVKSFPLKKKTQKYGNWAVDLRQQVRQLPRSENETWTPVRLLNIITQYLIGYQTALEAHDLVQIADLLEYLDHYFSRQIVSLDEAMTENEKEFYQYFQGLKDEVGKGSLIHHENQNLEKLSSVIKRHLTEKGPDSRGIIFVKTRATAEALKSWLNRCRHADIEKLDASIFTGTNKKESEGGMTKAQQSTLLKKFKEGKVRLLVATSVAEEGLDVPSCNLVIKYNYVGNEITTIQTRGRSRKEGGYSVLLGMPDLCQKESLNCEKAKLMEEGVKFLVKGTVKDFESSIRDLQNEDSNKRKNDALAASQQKEEYKDKSFKMFCDRCHQFCVEGKDLRIIGSYRIVVNRNVWNHARISPNSSAEQIDETKRIASVKCRAEVDDVRCNMHLGYLILYRKVTYLALALKSIIFEEEEKTWLSPKKKWKEVPYSIESLSEEDIRRYLTEQPNEQGASNEEGTATNQLMQYSGVQETEPPGSQLNFAQSFDNSSDEFSTRQESCIASDDNSSRDTDEIVRGYPETPDSALSSFCSRDSYNATERKEFV